MATRAEQDTLLTSLLADNTTGAISANDMRTVLNNLENNAVWAVVDSAAPSTAAEREGDLHVDTSTTPHTVYIARDTNAASDYEVLCTLSGTQTLTNKTLTTPIIGTIRDTNNNEVLVMPTVSSAVNYSQISASATGNDVVYGAAGFDTDIGIAITPKGAGNVSIGNFVFNADATVGASQDNYVLTYDHSAGTWGPEAASGGGGSGFTQEQIEDIVGSMLTTGSYTLLTPTYDDVNGNIDLVVDNDLANYSNTNSQFVTASTAPVTSVAGKTGAVALAATDISSGTFADARIASSNVTQHEASLTIAASQVTGTFGTSSLVDEAVTLAKLAHMATDSFLGRDTAGIGDVEVLSAATARTILNVEDGADVTDETNVTAALDAATLVDVGTPAGTDRILIQDVSAGDLKYVAFSEFAASSVSSQAGAPSSTPASVGLINVDTTNDIAYISTGTASSADWDQAAGWSTLTDPGADAIQGWDDSAGTTIFFGLGSGLTSSGTDFLVDTSVVATLTGTQTLTNKTLTTPVIAQINDANGNESAIFTATGSAVNEVTFTNAATGNAPNIAATGGDTNVDLELTAKGTGVVKGPLVPYAFAISDETTALTTGTAKLTYVMPRGFEVEEIYACVTTAPTGSTLIIDVNDDGTTLMTTNKLVIDATETSTNTAATAPTLTSTTIAAGSVLTFDIDQVGSTVAGAGAKVTLLGRWT